MTTVHILQVCVCSFFSFFHFFPLYISFFLFFDFSRSFSIVGWIVLVIDCCFVVVVVVVSCMSKRPTGEAPPTSVLVRTVHTNHW